ncbi:hypothetical protein [Actinokineospora sp.]|uniref:hypothetical protein n=1 Tax=Actinokineospora sp. TaxID=1872133 RepID=UPI004038364F
METAAPWRAPALVAGAAVGLPLVVGGVLGWPTWATVVVFVLSVAAGALAVKQILFVREQRQLRSEAVRENRKPAPPRPPHDEHEVPAIPVDSAEPYYRFILSCTVCWTSDAAAARHGNPRGLAVHAILERARQITVTGSPTDSPVVQARLAAELGTMLPDRSGSIVAWAEGVALSVPEEDARRLARLAELRKEKQVLHHERDLEQTARTYLADDVLTDPGSAVVWWLARHPEQVREAAALLPTFARLSAAVTDTEIAPQYAERLDAPAPERPTLSAVNGERVRLTGQDGERRQLTRPEESDSDSPA